MRILVLSWEFPPRVIGGIARHVGELYPEIVNLGHEIHLITVSTAQLPIYEVVEGIFVHRLEVPEVSEFFQWVTSMNRRMKSYILSALEEINDWDIIHAHDWLVGEAAIALKHYFKRPLVVTIHATEHGRNNGIYSDTHRYVNQQEKQLTYEAWRVIVCSQYMRHELERVLQTPWEKAEVIFNGIRPEKKQRLPDFNPLQFRRQFAPDGDKIVYYVGRLTYEKGISIFLQAMPQVLEAMDGSVRFFIIGGGNSSQFQDLAQELGMDKHCTFTGFMADDDLDKFQSVADCAVFPSLYEPFGIVALESFAAQVPVVVSNTGGLPEVVSHGKTGIVTKANVPSSLAWGILEILENPDYAKVLAEQAYADLSRRFDWAQLAIATVAVYERVAQERTMVNWE